MGDVVRDGIDVQVQGDREQGASSDALLWLSAVSTWSALVPIIKRSAACAENPTPPETYRCSS